jgi:hypothetical protein
MELVWGSMFPLNGMGVTSPFLRVLCPPPPVFVEEETC